MKFQASLLTTILDHYSVENQHKLWTLGFSLSGSHVTELQIQCKRSSLAVS